MPANSRIIPYEQTNTVIVTDTGSNIAKLNKMLEILDVEGYDAGIEVIPVKYASAAELSKLIDTLIPGTGSAPAARRALPASAAWRRRPVHARRTKEGGIINTIIADERTNTLIVHANTKGADQVRELVAKLDQKLPATGGGKVHVVYLQFADAEQIANTLNNISSQARTAAARPRGGPGAAARASNPVAAVAFRRQHQDLARQSRPTPRDHGFSGRLRDGPARDQPTGYPARPSLCRSRDHGSRNRPGLRLSPPISSAPRFGHRSARTRDLFELHHEPSRAERRGPRLRGGRPTTINDRQPEASGLQRSGPDQGDSDQPNANVLATPQIIALDNTEANFESAEKIPVPTITAVQGAGVRLSITKESVPLSIKIKPQINKISNFVKLDVDDQDRRYQRTELPDQVQQARPLPRSNARPRLRSSSATPIRSSSAA